MYILFRNQIHSSFPMTDQLNLFGDLEIDKKQQLQLRVPTGQWVKKSVSKALQVRLIRCDYV